MRLSLIALVLLGLSACVSFNPVPIEELTFRERVETEEQDGVRVSVAVLSREEKRPVRPLASTCRNEVFSLSGWK